jgi:tryptophan synthase alpha chain
MADGPVIQKATERALLYHVSLHDVLDMVRQFRSKDNETPVVLMGYLNPVEIMGYENFASQAASAGVDGVLTVDLPPEEADELLASLKKHELDPIFLLSPTSSSGRISQICAAASGFVYYVSLKGVTGAANLDVAAVAGKLQEIRQHTGLPLGVGFGIKDAETAAAVASVADAVVVGSAVVKLMEAAAGDTQAIIRDVCKLLSGMRQAMDK